LIAAFSRCRVRTKRLDDFCWGAEHEVAVWHLCALGDKRIGADETAFSDDGAVEYDCVHADERAVSDGAAVEHGLVANCDPLSNLDREAVVNVNDTVVLHIAASPDRDPGIVAAQHGAEPHRHLITQHNVTDDGRTGCDEVLTECGDRFLIELIFHMRIPVFSERFF